MKKLITAAVAVAVAVSLVGCGAGGASSAPDVDIEALALQMTWDGLAKSDQMLMCKGFAAYPVMVVDNIITGAGGGLHRPSLEQFLQEKCSGR